MTDVNKAELAKKITESYRNTRANPSPNPRCFIGFDGFTDEIIDVVRTRKGLQYEKMDQMEELGSRIVESAGKSCNLELVVREKKIGGNGPILGNALLEGGHRIVFAGAIGDKKKIEPLFEEMASRFEKVYPLGPSGHSDAMEFHDGKVILGKYEALLDMNYEKIIQEIGKEELTKVLDGADLFISANWTMLPGMTEIWEKMSEEIVPVLSKRESKRPRRMFIDLADPAKRTDEEVAKALRAMKSLNEGFRVTLGLNHSEGLRIAKVLGSAVSDDASFEALSKKILQHSGLHQVIIHSSKNTAASTQDESVSAETVHTPKPKLTTGAGDNFNAGFCNGLLYDYSLYECLLMGNATAGFYVRNGRSPHMDELSEFILNWEKGTL